MRRSTIGVLLQLTAVIALLIGHALAGVGVSGFAVPLGVADPPQVGDCVLAAPEPTLDTVVPPVAFGPCRGVVAGEIVSVVLRHPGSAGRAAASADDSVGSLMGTAGDCWEAASRYVGLSTVAGVAALPATSGVAASVVDPLIWEPGLRVRGQLVGADALQRATGRGWSACMVRPQDLNVYLGSVRSAVDGGRAPAPYGDCAAGDGVPMQSSVPCDRPHLAERLGWAAVPTGTLTPAAVSASCRELAVRLLRVGDPSYSGLLQVVVTRGDVTSCSIEIRGRARLTASLIGIAGRPLPLAT